MRIVALTMLAALGAAGVAGTASAQVFTLNDRNSRATFDVSNGGGGQIGWSVDGVNQLFNQRFFFRAGSMSDEAALDSLPLTFSEASNTNTFVDPRPDTLALGYSSTLGLDFQVSYLLRGSNAGSGLSDLAETIQIINRTSAPITLSFFQYVDFDLNGSSGGDLAQVQNANAVRQWEGAVTVAETVVTPAPSRFQVGDFPRIVSLFGNGLADNLSNFGGPIGPTDASWAFQWDITLPGFGEYIISKDKNIIIPAPTGVAVLGLAGLVAARRRRTA